jgi:hypothetical protein
MMLDMLHPTRGMRLDVAIDLDAMRDGFVEVVLDPSARITVVLQDGTVPLEGIAPLIGSESRPPSLPMPGSNASGATSIVNVTPGRYRLHIDHPGLWPTRRVVEASAGASPQTLQVRRLGDLRVEMRASDGTPASGVALGLRSEELGEDVAIWLAQGRCLGSLTTALDGTTTVSGLPNGIYAWRVVHGGAVFDGTVIVPPRDCGRLLVELP